MNFTSTDSKISYFQQNVKEVKAEEQPGFELGKESKEVKPPRAKSPRQSSVYESVLL